MNSLHRQRLERLRQALIEAHLSQMVICDPLSIWYLTGTMVEPGERLYALYVSTEGKLCMIANRLFQVEDADLPVVWITDSDDGVAILAQQVDARADLGIDKKWPARFLLPLMDLNPGVRYRDASFCVDQLRLIKDEQELEKMRVASAINDRCMEAAAAYIKEGMTERQCAAYIDSLYQEAGCEGPSFTTIVSFGPHAADPHHAPDDTTLKEGDCIVIDMGCVKDRYCSDMTRTFFCKKADETYAAIHDLVREANEKAESIIRPGVPLCEIDRVAREHIASRGYGPFFTHRLGHMIGLEDHDPGDVSSASKDVAREGMVFSIEPGVYLPGKFGVRVEDLVIVTADGCEILNHVDKHWKIIG